MRRRGRPYEGGRKPRPVVRGRIVGYHLVLPGTVRYRPAIASIVRLSPRVRRWGGQGAKLWFEARSTEGARELRGELVRSGARVVAAIRKAAP